MGSGWMELIKGPNFTLVYPNIFGKNSIWLVKIVCFVWDVSFNNATNEKPFSLTKNISSITYSHFLIVEFFSFKGPSLTQPWQKFLIDVFHCFSNHGLEWEIKKTPLGKLMKPLWWRKFKACHIILWFFLIGFFNWLKLVQLLKKVSTQSTCSGIRDGMRINQNQSWAKKLGSLWFMNFS